MVFIKWALPLVVIKSDTNLYRGYSTYATEIETAIERGRLIANWKIYEECVRSIGSRGLHQTKLMQSVGLLFTICHSNPLGRYFRSIFQYIYIVNCDNEIENMIHPYHVMQCSRKCSITLAIYLSHTFHNAPVPYTKMHNFITKMCICMHMSLAQWCIVEYLSDALWNLSDGSLSLLPNSRTSQYSLRKTNKTEHTLPANNMEHLEITMGTIAFYILICWKWLGTHHKQVLWL